LGSALGFTDVVCEQLGLAKTSEKCYNIDV